MQGSRRASACVFVIPGDWLTPTGGYRYDRAIVLAMRDAGWHVEHVALADGFPWPHAQVLADADARLSALPDGALVVVDGLAFGALPDTIEWHAGRLRWVALVHHPLHLETGLGEAARKHLRESEARALRSARLVVVTSTSTVADVVALGVEATRIVVIEPGVDALATQEADAAGSTALAAPPEEAVLRGATSSTAHSISLGAGRIDAAASHRAPPTEEAVRLLCVASLVPRKGHAVLLQALCGLLAIDWTLDCIGSDRLDRRHAASLHEAAARLGVAARVRWLGEQPPSRVAEAYAAADVFVLPSFYEGYGMVIAEALSHGLPIITTTGGALARTLPAGAGLHVRPGDAPALGEALRTLMADRPLRDRMALGAKKAASGLITWSEAARRFAAALEQVA